VVVVEQEAICLRRAKEATYGNAYKYFIISLKLRKFISPKIYKCRQHLNISMVKIADYLQNLYTGKVKKRNIYI